MKENITRAEVQDRINELKSSITNLIVEFEKETDCEVERVELERFKHLFVSQDRPVSYLSRVTLDVRLI